MAFRNTPRFLEWVLVSTFKVQLYYFFVTLGGQPIGFRRSSWFLNLPITALYKAVAREPLDHLEQLGLTPALLFDFGNIMRINTGEGERCNAGVVFGSCVCSHGG